MVHFYYILIRCDYFSNFQSYRVLKNLIYIYIKYNNVYLQGKAVNKDKFISKMFLRGDSVILVLRNPLATAAGK